MARSVGQSDRRRRRMTTAEQETAVSLIDIKGRWWPGSQQSRVAAFVSQYPHLPFEVWDAAVLKTNSVRLV